MPLQTTGLFPYQRHPRPLFMLMQNRVAPILAGTEVEWLVQANTVLSQE